MFGGLKKLSLNLFPLEIRASESFKDSLTLIVSLAAETMRKQENRRDKSWIIAMVSFLCLLGNLDINLF